MQYSPKWFRFHDTIRGEEERGCMGDLGEVQLFLPRLPYKHFLSIFDLGGPFGCLPMLLGKGALALCKLLEENH